MKKFKLSEFLILFLGVAFFFAVAPLKDGNAIATTQYNRSVREMMARRHNATLGYSNGEDIAQPKVSEARIGRSAGSNVKTSVMTTIYPHDAMYSRMSSTSTFLTSLFSFPDKDGSLFPGGPCKNCHKSGPIFQGGSCKRCLDSGPLIDTGPCEKCEEPEPVVAPVPVPVYQPMYAISYNDYIVQALSRDCCAMAPIYLEHVDFNLFADGENVSKNKMGNYRFRIFGCRRYDREAILNHGRVMEKNMHFSEIFEQVTGDCYNILPMPQDICLQNEPKPMPEYILTAEITNFFMNVCDGYDYDQVKATDKRSGTSEITVRWKLSNPSKTKIVWEGETTGYADLKLGEEEGEIALVEAAFADATENLKAAKGFEDQLMIRLTPEELTAERNALIDEEVALDPAKCRFSKELHEVHQCELTRPDADIRNCPAVQQVLEVNSCEETPLPCEEGSVSCEGGVNGVHEACDIEQNTGIETDYTILDNCIDENGDIISGGDCMIVDDTWIETDSKEEALESLCITSRKPNGLFTPEKLYKTRASVVEISNMAGKKGAGLIVSDEFVLTSADLVDNENNFNKVRTINGKEFTARAVRVNPVKNTALLMLDIKTEYSPLALNLDLPKSGETGLMVVGMMDVEVFDNGMENYLDNNGKVLGYRYSDEKGSEIIVDTHVQDLVIGSVLIDQSGSIVGLAHTGQKTDDGKDLFLPTETALRSLGLTICDYIYEKPSPFRQTVYKPVTELILNSTPKAPEILKKEERK